MNGLEFIIDLLSIISMDIICAIILFIIYKFVDLRYFSDLEIEQLKIENKYLKEENQKLNGTSTDFWSKK